MKKVLLVNTNTYKVPYPVPPVGLCLVAAAIEARYAVRLYDAMRDGSAPLEQAVRDFRPDYIGLGIRNIDDVSMTSRIYFIDGIRRDFVEPIRRISAAPLILGGGAFSLFPREIFDHFGADYGVVGEAEEALPALLAALDRGEDPGGIPGVMTARSGAVAPRRLQELAGRPVADIARRLDFTPYRARGAYSVQTKRGCRHACIYCSYPALEGHALRPRPVGDVVDEIERALPHVGGAMFEFVDAVFNDPPGHAEAICREIIRRGLRLRLRTMGVNPAGVTSELLDLMRRAGFVQIDSTPDAASPAVLRALRKNFTLDELQATARLIRRHDMPTMWFFLLGGPGESEATVAETLRFIDDYVYEEDMVYITEGLRIYPRTELRDLAIKEGVLRADEPLLEPRFYVSPGLGAERLNALVRQATAARLNCFGAGESTPPPGLLDAALRLRQEQRLTEPMFRTLLRLRRARANGTAAK